MIVDCHGHYTTAPPQLGEYRDAQKAALRADPGHVGEKGSISISDEGYSQVHAEVVNASRRNMVVAHHEKLEAFGFIRTASFDDIDCLITDRGLDDDSRARLEGADIEVVLA